MNTIHISKLFFCRAQSTSRNLSMHKDLISKDTRDLDELRVQKDTLQNERKCAYLIFCMSFPVVICDE